MVPSGPAVGDRWGRMRDVAENGVRVSRSWGSSGTPETITVEAPGYRLRVAAGDSTARLWDTTGRWVAELNLLGALDCLQGPDETTALEPVMVDCAGPHPVLLLRRSSTRWESAAARVECRPGEIELSWEVRGRGTLDGVHLLAGRSVMAGGGSGFTPSGGAFRTLFSPNPGDPRRLVRGAGESAVIGVVGDAGPGRGHWFSTPAPLCLVLTTAAVREPEQRLPEGERWWTLALGGPVDQLNFTQLRYLPADNGFALRLDYEGQTRVDGAFRTPPVVLAAGHRDPYQGLRWYRGYLSARGWAPPRPDDHPQPAADRAQAVTDAPGPAAPHRQPRPAWWSAPMFCGWGAQNHLAATRRGATAPDLSTQANYDRFLDELEARGLVPGTVVIDDKWQAHYGTCEPDTTKWPDLPGWIARRQADGQRVLLWWAAWEWDGLPDELCVRNPSGQPVALDPSHPAARRVLAANVARMLGRDGLNADGLKIDFTARTPSGTALHRYGPAWGIALLHQMLAVVHAEAKRVKPDALIVTQTPHPSFADVTDMIRLNDMLRLDDFEPDAPVVPQMRYRAAVAAASCPELLLDTDDWCAPDLTGWREYLAVKPEIGVPSLYYTTHLDRTGQALEPDDYATLREVWARAGRPARGKPC
ncbi:hypothetical protein AQ490_15035 [Wenjunlia vitaminophila]|uniref:Alpha-galactosidase n=1 Tax=Wenjunlia vitaminophila TaxID=76728 RepID=A0A0T6LWH1_WENVI|nr:hypothetical protein AQ490_15035 [Wenjunlia vitaminophila]